MIFNEKQRGGGDFIPDGSFGNVNGGVTDGIMPGRGNGGRVGDSLGDAGGDGWTHGGSGDYGVA